MADQPPQSGRATWGNAVALFLVAINLRLALASVPPLLGQIGADLHLSATAAGAITTLMVVAMGLFAPVGHRVAARIGPARTVLWSVALTGAGSLVRLGGGHPAMLYLGTLLAGIGIAICGAVLPRIVKELFPPHRSGVATGLYMLAMMAGAIIAPAVSVPLAAALGSWQASLASWSLVALVGIAAWWPVARRERFEPPTGVTLHLPWRHRTAILVSLYLATQSWQFYSSLAWIPPTFVQHGWPAEDAGYVLSVFFLAQFVGGLVGPMWADRAIDVRPMLYGALVIGFAGELGLWLAPTGATYLWVVLMGLSQSAGFATGLVMLVRYAASATGSGRLTAMGFLIGYGVAAIGPTAMGAVRDATGGFQAVWAALAALIVVQIGLTVTLRPDLAKVD